MIKKKICMIGAFAVGKTSLVKRFVDSLFSDKYLTTVGVKIDKKTVVVKEKKVDLLLWDIHGEDEFQKLNTSYLRGSSGYFIVVDGTRKSTFETALTLFDKVRNTLGDVPFICLLNKMDIEDQWELSTEEINELNQLNWQCIHTSAKTGQGVEDAFIKLTHTMLED